LCHKLFEVIFYKFYWIVKDILQVVLNNDSNNKSTWIFADNKQLTIAPTGCRNQCHFSRLPLSLLPLSKKSKKAKKKKKKKKKKEKVVKRHEKKKKNVKMSATAKRNRKRKRNCNGKPSIHATQSRPAH